MSATVKSCDQIVDCCEEFCLRIHGWGWQWSCLCFQVGKKVATADAFQYFFDVTQDWVWGVVVLKVIELSYGFSLGLKLLMRSCPPSFNSLWEMPVLSCFLALIKLASIQKCFVLFLDSPPCVMPLMCLHSTHIDSSLQSLCLLRYVPVSFSGTIEKVS